MTNARLEKAKEYAMSRTYPRFDSIFISNFVHREIEGAYLEGSKETENLEHQIKNVQRALNKWVDKAKENKKEVIKLLAQIEKMKCCANCSLHCASSITIETCISNNHNKWKLQEIKE